MSALRAQVQSDPGLVGKGYMPLILFAAPFVLGTLGRWLSVPETAMYVLLAVPSLIWLWVVISFWKWLLRRHGVSFFMHLFAASMLLLLAAGGVALCYGIGLGVGYHQIEVGRGTP